MRDIEYHLSNSADYILEHDKYSIEIGANLYSIEKAKEFIKNDFPKLYEKCKDKIEKSKNK